MIDPDLTTLIARPRSWQRIQRWPGVLLLAGGLWSLFYQLEVAALAFIAVGFWGTAEFWRGIRVTGDRLIAHGRTARRTVPLVEILQVGSTPSRSVWVRARGRRTLVLHMAEQRTDQPGTIGDIRDRLRELAEQAGADLDPPLDGPQRPPRPATPFFGW